jgi:hypothetical protein
MNKYRNLADIGDSLRASIDWSHSFVRECYSSSRHHLVPLVRDGKAVLGDADGARDIRLIVVLPSDPDVCAIEFLCMDVANFSMTVMDELSFD